MKLFGTTGQILNRFVPGRAGTEEFVPGHMLLPLSRDNGTPGQEFFFVPGQRDNGTSRPGLSRDVPRDVLSRGNPTVQWVITKYLLYSCYIFDHTLRQSTVALVFCLKKEETQRHITIFVDSKKSCPTLATALDNGAKTFMKIAFKFHVHSSSNFIHILI